MSGNRLTIAQSAVERAARIYPTNSAAAQALRIGVDSFKKLCRAFDIETPHARARRLDHKEADSD